MSYLAVIFDPLKEQPQNDFVGGMGAFNNRRIVYPYSVQIPEGGELLPATVQKGKGGAVQDVYAVQRFESVFFRPSANLDIDAEKWQICQNYQGVQLRINLGALTAIVPEKEALEREPDGCGYHMYSVENALKLVKATNGLDLLETWALMEKRTEILNAAKAQYEAIEKHIRASREG